MKLRTVKRCRVCDVEFRVFRTTQVVCGVKCAAIDGQNFARRKQEKRLLEHRRGLRRERASARERLKSISKLLAEAQREYNRYVRERDWNLGCISCHMQASYDGQWQAGHYRTTAAAPHLRFHDDNVQKQCSQCNGSKSGNVVEYRKGLVVRIGVERVEAIENDNRTLKWSRDEIVAMRKQFTSAWRALRAAREQIAA